MFKISACTIARNEAKNIRHWVNSVRTFADEIFVVDTGSSDETREIAQEAGAVIYEFPWCNDFSAAKNFALDKAIGDWVVMLDADEYFDEPSQGKLRAVLQKYHPQKSIAGFITPFLNIDVDQGGKILSRAWQMRIFRREKQLRFAGKVHEALQNYAPDGKNRDFVLLKELQFIHTGYSTAIVQKKLERNLQILLKEIQEQGGEHPRQYGYLQDCYMGAQDYRKAIHYGLLALKHREEAGLMDQTNSIVCKLLNAMRFSGLADYRKELEKALKVYPDLPEIYFFYGQYLLFNMDGAGAKKALQKAKDLYEKPLTSAEDIRNLTVGNMPALIQENLKKIEKYEEYYRAMEAEDFHKAATVASQYLQSACAQYSLAGKEKAYFMNLRKTGERNLLTSIVILNKDLLAYTKQLIESIRQYTEKGSYEIIVVDNGSQDGSVEWLQQQDDVRLIANAENAGFPKGCNQGMEIAKGQEIMLLNNDTVVTTNWLANLRQALYSEPCIGAVGPVTNYCANLQKIEIPYPNENNPAAMEAMQRFAAAYNKSDPHKWHKWMMLIGFCMLFKREVYEQIGGLDEAYSPGNFEDDDYSIRIRKAGYEILLCKDTFIHHFGSRTFAQCEGKEESKYNDYLVRNRAYFCQKWNLKDDMYHRYQTILLGLKFADEPMRIIEYEAGNSMDLYILGSLCPQGDIMGTTRNKADLAIGCAYPMLYAENIVQFIDLLEGEYQLIIITEDIQKYGDKVQAIVEQIEKHLSVGGWLITVQNGQWLQMQRE